MEVIECGENLEPRRLKRARNTSGDGITRIAQIE
jgi:hypothetical protein